MTELKKNLDADLRRLQEIVERLEGKDVELEEALALFEEGMALVREAEGRLARAEGRLRELADVQTASGAGGAARAAGGERGGDERC